MFHKGSSEIQTRSTQLNHPPTLQMRSTMKSMSTMMIMIIILMIRRMIMAIQRMNMIMTMTMKNCQNLNTSLRMSLI